MEDRVFWRERVEEWVQWLRVCEGIDGLPLCLLPGKEGITGFCRRWKISVLVVWLVNLFVCSFLPFVTDKQIYTFKSLVSNRTGLCCYQRRREQKKKIPSVSVLSVVHQEIMTAWGSLDLSWIIYSSRDFCKTALLFTSISLIYPASSPLSLSCCKLTSACESWIFGACALVCACVAQAHVFKEYELQITPSSYDDKFYWGLFMFVCMCVCACVYVCACMRARANLPNSQVTR